MPHLRALWCCLLVVVAGGCLPAPPRFSSMPTSSGPRAQEVFLASSYLQYGREPTFDERRRWQDRMDLRISAYLDDHPELQRSERYSEFRLWRQVVDGSTREEVKILLDTPLETTLEPGRMAALATPAHWPFLSGRAREAWVYPNWVLLFDDTAVISMLKMAGPPPPGAGGGMATP